MKLAFIYSFKIWLTAIILGAVGFDIIFYATGPVGPEGFRIQDSLEIFGVALLISAAFSSPCLLCLMFISKMLSVRIHKIKQLKLSISIASIILSALLIAFVCLYFYKDSSALLFYSILPYPVIVIAGIWFYKLEPWEMPVTNEDKQAEGA